MSDMAAEFVSRPFTIDEYHRIAETGVFGRERLELLGGAIVPMSPIGTEHWVRHMEIASYLVRNLAERAYVAGQAAVRLGGDSEPQPDIVVLAPRSYRAPAPPPAPADIFAIVEIADASLFTDTGPKLRLYARHLIAEYLVVDVRDGELLRYRDPHALGYRLLDRLRCGDAFSLAALPEIPLSADVFLGAS